MRNLLLKLFGLCVIGVGTLRANDLQQWQQLTVEESQRLAQDRSRWLTPDGLTEVAEDVAAALGQHKGKLHLDGLAEAHPKDDRRRMDEYLPAICEIEQRIERAASFPAEPKPALSIEAGIPKDCQEQPDKVSEADNAREVTNSLGMKLAYIPPGTFMMGSPESESGREAQEVQHEVKLVKGFYLGAHEVTFGQFKQFVVDTKYQTDGERDGKGAYGVNEAGKIEEMHARFTWKTPGFVQADDHPVVAVSWKDAKAFCDWLSQKEKKTYRLPREAEWEYACRAGTKTAYVHGDDPEGLATVGNGADATARSKFRGWSIGIKGMDGHLFTAPVGQFKANAFGLFDMHGNVWEWCEDWYVPNSYPKEKQIDPTGPATGKAKVQRGGGWSSDFKRLRSAARVGRDQSAYRGCYLGFRVVLETSPAIILKESEATPKTPAGGRFAYKLLVNGAVTDAVVKSANIEGHKSVDAPYVGTWHSFVKGMDQIQKGRSIRSSEARST